MQTDAEVAAIAAGLTKAQRAMLESPVCLIDGFRVQTRIKLYRLGMVEYFDGKFGARYFRVTPLGLRVAQHLKQENAKP